MNFESGEIVAAPFRFTDSDVWKSRPLLIVSTEAFFEQTGHLIVVMITSGERSNWPDDILIDEWRAAGLRKPCFVRTKIATIAASTVERRIGCADHALLANTRSKLVRFLT